MAYVVQSESGMERKSGGHIDRSCSLDELLDHLVLGVLLIGYRLHLAPLPAEAGERRRADRRVSTDRRRPQNDRRASAQILFHA